MNLVEFFRRGRHGLRATDPAFVHVLPDGVMAKSFPPRTMGEERVAAVMAHLEAGGAITSAPVSYGVIKRHAAAFPEWWAAARALSLKNTERRGTTAAAAKALSKTTCKHGHSLTGSNLLIRTEGKRVRRRCAECLRMKNTAGTRLGADVVAKLRDGLASGLRISHLVSTRASKTRISTNWAGLRRLRREDPAIDAMVLRAIRRHSATISPKGPALTGNIAAQPNEIYSAINDALPRSLPDQIRQEAMGEMMLAVLERKATLADACANHRRYVVEAYRMFPIDNAKFGSAKLVSLDEVIFDGSRSTRADLISEGLWS